MKKCFLILCILSSFQLFSQVKLTNPYEPGTIYFKDGTFKKGYLKITSSRKVKFKKTLKNKKQVFDFKTVTKIKGNYFGEHYYKKWGTTDSSYNLFKIETKGKVELYSLTYQGRNGGGGLFIYTDYYIGKANLNTVDQLPERVEGKKFRRIFLKHTSDCQDFTDKIKSKNSIKKNFKNKKTVLVDMVNYYNENCN